MAHFDVLNNANMIEDELIFEQGKLNSLETPMMLYTQLLLVVFSIEGM